MQSIFYLSLDLKPMLQSFFYRQNSKHSHPSLVFVGDFSCSTFSSQLLHLCKTTPQALDKMIMLAGGLVKLIEMMVGVYI